LAAFVITAASAVALLRVLLEVAVVAPRHWVAVAPPLLMTLAVLSLAAVVLFFRHRRAGAVAEEPENPAQFKAALVFAVLYALILFAVAWVKDAFGDAGLYVVSVLSGLTDVDAITLSLTNTMNAGSLEASSGWRFILVAALANLVFKAVLAGVIGRWPLLKAILPAFALALLTGFLLLFFW
ncbi:MAG: DUF4010 domain-containing protein, partial [Saprospiraceae bacterium]|nr:DUF4010 domain-containing protein [Saprospiraceae bacterium]